MNDAVRGLVYNMCVEIPGSSLTDRLSVVLSLCGRRIHLFKL